MWKSNLKLLIISIVIHDYLHCISAYILQELCITVKNVKIRAAMEIITLYSKAKIKCLSG